MTSFPTPETDAIESIDELRPHAERLEAELIRLRQQRDSLIKKYLGVRESIREQLQRREGNPSDGNVIIEWGAWERSNDFFKMFEEMYDLTI